MSPRHQPAAASEAGVGPDPHARLAVALVLSLVLWAPFGLGALRGEIDVVAAAVRYLVAFVGTSVAVHGISHLLASYQQLQTGTVSAAPSSPSGAPAPEAEAPTS